MEQEQKQEGSLRVMGTFRFGARCVYKRKEIPPPILGGRLFETISGYFPNPAIPPLGHYTSWSADSAGNKNWSNITATGQLHWKRFRRHAKATQKHCIQKHLEITAHTMKIIHGTLITTNVIESKAELSRSEEYKLYRMNTSFTYFQSKPEISRLKT